MCGAPDSGLVVLLRPDGGGAEDEAGIGVCERRRLVWALIVITKLSRIRH